ncbi:seizure protein 6 homolog isoform X2 [Gouania willdenowi]|uniref:seizure protein 6 homolog isoform X2 n=1 Tax=Gouania willdenowi TaxID=441366 RepID=UPI0010552D08|nr:seizure protein 6 homolog isoform X2 [Gouania willdenowi]
MTAIKAYLLMLLVVAAETDRDAKASVSKDELFVTSADTQVGKDTITYNVTRELPVSSTTPPTNDLNHNPLYRSTLQHQRMLRSPSHPGYLQDSRGLNSEPAALPSAPSALCSVGDKSSQCEKAKSANMTAAAHHLKTFMPNTHTNSKDQGGSTQVTSFTTAATQNNTKPGNDNEKTTTTTIRSTTIIPVTQSSVLCQMNLTMPEGYIEVPPKSSSSFQSTTDCSFIITVYMGFGVEVQVMKTNLSEGEKVVFEDVVPGDNVMLANDSILNSGRVVRSHSNQIVIRIHGARLQAALLLLRYQAYVLSCAIPNRPLYGDISVSSLHPGGEALFSCLSGYQLKGLRVLTCHNASTPYWNGKEPYCKAACGGLIRNITVGQIISPGFPSNYSNNMTCHWLLEAPEGQRLHIHFEKVALAEDDDRLLIKNGNSIDSLVLYDSYEVEYLPNEGLLSTSRHLFMEFTTDAMGTSTGIAIRYQGFAEGHCYQPFIKYGNLTSTDRTWAVGSIAEFACSPGYTMEQGSATIECIDHNNPQWNETEPACKAVCSGEITDSAGVVLSPNWPEAYDKGQDCIWGVHVEEDKRIMLDIQVLNIGENDLFTVYDGDDLTAKVLGQYKGSKPHFKFFTSTADVTIQFQSDPATVIYGYGNGFMVHFFEVPRNDTCPELPEISNGWKTISHPELVHGTVVTYQCYPGYQVVGTELLMCQWDLTWSGEIPSCERVVFCPDPGKVEHSRRVSSSPQFTVGSTIQYICNKGFTLSGNSLLTCFQRGSSSPRWSQKLPTCVSETFGVCNHPGTPTYGKPSSHKLHFQAGESLFYSCLDGHQLLGKPVLRCIPGHPSQWSGLPPVCKVSSADLSMVGARVAFAVFLPTLLVLAIITGIYIYFFRIQQKPQRLSISSNFPYQNMPRESLLDNSGNQGI